MSLDLDVQCFQKQQINLGSAGQGLRKDNFLAWFYHTYAPAKLKKDKTTTTIMERETNFKKRNLQNDTILV